MRVTRRAIARLSLALLAGTRTAHAQRLAGLPRVGVLEGSAPSVFADRVQALRQGLAELGYVDGQGVALDIRWAQGRLAELLAAGHVDERSDVFAIGIMAYESLVGRRPYTARSWPELITQTLEGRVTVPGDGEGARRLERVLARCLAGVAMDRYPDVRSAQRELVPALLGAGGIGLDSGRTGVSGTDPTLLYGGDS